MNIKDLADKILDFAKNNPNGFTLNIRTMEPVTTGYVVSYKATQNSFSANDLQSVVSHALKHDGIVGGWYNEKNNKFYFDSNKVFNNITKAIKFGFKNNQLSIYDIDTNHTIWLDNQPLTKEYNFSTFADWMLSTANQVVKHYKGDILIDCKQIVELRNKHLYNLEEVETQGFSFYWGVRETGTWIRHVGIDSLFSLNDLMKGLGAKNVYLITFQYDSAKNEIITIQEVDKETI